MMYSNLFTSGKDIQAVLKMCAFFQYLRSATVKRFLKVNMYYLSSVENMHCDGKLWTIMYI